MPDDDRSRRRSAPELDLEPPADLVITGAAILDRDVVQAIAVKGDQIVAVGPAPEIQRYVGDDTRVIDASGGTVVPGFCDCHVHIMAGAERYHGISVEEVETFEQLQARVVDFADSNPDLTAIRVYGLHYLTPPILPPERTRELLDAMVPDRPLLISAHDLHTAWANSRALEEAGLLEPMPPYPPLLEHLQVTENLVLDQSGRPSGEMKEPDVYFLVEGPMRADHPLSVEQKLDYLERAARSMNEAGITSVHNMGLAVPEEDVESLMLLLELEEKARLPVRVHTSYSVLPDEHAIDDVRHAAALRDRLDTARAGEITAEELHDLLLEGLQEAAALRHETARGLLERHSDPAHDRDARTLARVNHDLERISHDTHVKGHLGRASTRRDETHGRRVAPIGRVHFHTVKLFVDGVVEQDTAYRLDLGPSEGVPGFPPARLEQVVVEADRLGLQVAAHCIGDGAVRAMLDAVAAARAANSDLDQRRGHRIRHRVEHIELCRSEDITRFADLEVVASMQPLHEHEPPTLWHQKVGVEHWATAFPWRGLLGVGATLVFGSDWPIVGFECLAAVEHAVTRRAWSPDLPASALTPVQAIDGFTRRPPLAEGQEQRRGRLVPGMLADLVLLDRDLRRDEALEKIQVVRTLVGGQSVYPVD